MLRQLQLSTKSMYCGTGFNKMFVTGYLWWAINSNNFPPNTVPLHFHPTNNVIHSVCSRPPWPDSTQLFIRPEDSVSSAYYENAICLFLQLIPLAKRNKEFFCNRSNWNTPLFHYLPSVNSTPPSWLPWKIHKFLPPVLPHQSLCFPPFITFQTCNTLPSTVRST